MQIKEVFTKLEKSCNQALGTEGGVELRKMDFTEFTDYAVEQIEKADKEAKRRPGLAKARIHALQTSIAVAKSSFSSGGPDSFDIPVFGENQTIAMADIDSRFQSLEATVTGLSSKLQTKSDDEKEEEEKAKKAKEKEEEEEEEKRKKAKSDDEKDEEEKAKKAKADDEKEEEEKRRKAMTDEEREEEDKKRRKAMTDEEREEEDKKKKADEEKAKKAKEKEDEEKGKLAKCDWPLDMNPRSSTELSKSDKDAMDWGSDPE